MEFTKEQLIRRAHLTVSRGARELENHPDRDGVAADIKIASIAARALMAEPIYQLWDEGYYDTEKEIYDAALKAGGRGRIVYTAPPAPECLTRPVHPRISSEELDDETLDELIDFRRCTFEYHSQQDNKVQTIIHGVTLTAMLELRERRAAMLQGAEPVSQRDELPLDYLQGHKDGLEWAAQLAEANHPQTADWLYDDPLELAKAIRKGPDMPEASGNSPVVPDGYVLVPVEPTMSQEFAGYRTLTDTGKMSRLMKTRLSNIYRAMIAAAPQQEVKNG